KVPFGALDGQLHSLGVNLGDFGLAIRHDKNLQSGFYFVDSGADPGQFALGESSHKLGKDLGGTGRGDFFDNNYPTSFIIFPRSSTQPANNIRELSEADIASALQPRLFELSRAANALELALLMGFNEVDPLATPRGKEKLAAYLSTPGSPKPRN